MSSIANQTNEINTGQYTQYSATLPSYNSKKIYEATQDCQIIVYSDVNVYWKLNAPTSGADCDFENRASYALIKNISMFNKNIKVIAHRDVSGNYRPYTQLDLQKGDSLYAYYVGSSSITVTYYVRSN